MAEKHDHIESQHRRRLLREGYRIQRKSPFVDYRPDIFAEKNGVKVFCEVELGETLNSEHTRKQLEIMHLYLRKNRHCQGFLIVPKRERGQALFLVESIFGDDLIRVSAV